MENTVFLLCCFNFCDSNETKTTGIHFSFFLPRIYELKFFFPCVSKTGESFMKFLLILMCLCFFASVNHHTVYSMPSSFPPPKEIFQFTTVEPIKKFTFWLWVGWCEWISSRYESTSFMAPEHTHFLLASPQNVAHKRKAIIQMRKNKEDRKLA